MNKPRILPLIAMFAFAAFPLFASARPNSLVSLKDLHQAVRNAAAIRAADISQVERFLSTPAAVKALRSASLDPVEVQKAIPTLSDQELARLSSKTRHVQSEFAAGALSNQQLTYIVIGMGVLLIVALVLAA